MTVYERIEALRKSAGLSQGKLEKELGFSNGSISKWKTSTPTPERFQKLAEYFDVSIDYLITGNTGEQEATPGLSAREKRDITESFDHIMEELRKGNDKPLYYQGVSINEASLHVLANAFEFVLIETRKERKVKHNPAVHLDETLEP